MSKRIAIVLSVLLAMSFSAFANGQKDGGKPYIAVVSKGEQHDFWQQVKLGAMAAADEYAVDVTFEGPPSESDVQIQVEMLNNAMAKDPVAIALAALDTTSVMDQLEECKASGIPVIGFDSGVPNAPEGAIYANASTDNYNAAGMAAVEMFKVIKSDLEAATAAAPATIVVMNQDASGESLLSRGKGFRDNMIDLIVKETSLSEADIKVMGSPAYIDAKTPTSGKKVMIEMVVPASAANTDAMASSAAVLNKIEDVNILGIFCSNEATVKGLLAATNDGAELGSKYKGLVVLGFDAGEGQKNAVRSELFLGSITQDPYSIGYKAVELAFKAYEGKSVSDVDTGAKFYNKDNMDNDDIKGLLYD
ncbi:MAG: LacI family transcriptional regulator [Spirochaetaceae bacterium 4572_59]|nr:MAG: LacI family transcriptional regulator [Spirochaetaceae bacterium 4572_59]